MPDNLSVAPPSTLTTSRTRSSRADGRVGGDVRLIEEDPRPGFGGVLGVVGERAAVQGQRARGQVLAAWIVRIPPEFTTIGLKAPW